jgi:hypothetical protein
MTDRPRTHGGPLSPEKFYRPTPPRMSSSKNKTEIRANSLIVRLTHGDVLMLSGDDFQVSIVYHLAFPSIPTPACQVRNEADW